MIASSSEYDLKYDAVVAAVADDDDASSDHNSLCLSSLCAFCFESIVKFLLHAFEPFATVGLG